MASSRPFIGITPSYEYDEEKIYLNNNYVESINRAGGLPMILPLTEDRSN